MDDFSAGYSSALGAIEMWGIEHALLGERDWLDFSLELYIRGYKRAIDDYLVKAMNDEV